MILSNQLIQVHFVILKLYNLILKIIHSIIDQCDNNGFIIYSSDKNYTVNDNFSGRGGFGGNEQSFQNFLNTILSLLFQIHEH